MYESGLTGLNENRTIEGFESRRSYGCKEVGQDGGMNQEDKRTKKKE